MVFFNYSTMQMAAKIVYYGPGLCGKTTNLQYVYGHTSTDSRGEMVSLETETDRTLFFDLLPIDVGTIAGFRTKIQLYTVPGQVFYNTTRKLVLKGVDGVVFVADSQRPMLQANIDAFQNLEENLAEIGLTVKEVPLVLQFNKRDLRDVLTVKELNDALNRHDWPYYEASALEGQGVFETLKGISKLTLLSIKQKMQRNADKVEKPEASRARPAATPPPTAPGEPRPMPSSNPGPSVVHPPGAQAAPSPATSTGPSVATAERTREEPPPTASPSSEEQRQVDVLAELEKIRRQATSRERATAPKPAPERNGHGELSHAIRRSISRSALARTRRLSLVLQLEDEDDQIVDAVRERVRLDHPADLEKLLLKLDIALDSGG